MDAKRIIYSDEVRSRIRCGVDALADAVKVTLGPRGRTVIIEREFGAPQIVNSGVVVAKSIELEDHYENMGAQILREVAARTSEMAGDGTTTATVLAHCMIQEGLKYVAAGMNPMELKRGIEKGAETVIAALRKMAQPCATSQEIAHVAAISANNDASIGALVAQAMDKVGRDGAISIEDGSGMVSALDVVEGMQFDRGYLSPYFVNQPDRGSAVLENAQILLCDKRLSSLADLVPVLDSEALATLVINSVRGVIKVCAVKAPGFGDRRTLLLQDIAVLVGASIVSEETGLVLAKVTPEHLGSADRIEVDKDSTIIIGGKGAPEAIAKRVALIRQERGAADSEFDRKQADERLSKLAGGVALIKVGAVTETELKERKLREEDALHATRAAVEEGIVPGGGVALLRARSVLDALTLPTMDQKAGISIVARALEEPLRRIVINAADEPSIVVHTVREATEPNFGYNAATREYGNMLAMGIIDPAKVTRLALQNAAAIASLVLTTDCMVAAAAKPHIGHSRFGGAPAEMM
jgi:chaperonin GroEL